MGGASIHEGGTKLPECCSLLRRAGVCARVQAEIRSSALVLRLISVDWWCLDTHLFSLPLCYDGAGGTDGFLAAGHSRAKPWRHSGYTHASPHPPQRMAFSPPLAAPLKKD